MIQEIRDCVMMGECSHRQNKKVSPTVKMKDSGRNRALFHHIQRLSTLYRHLMGEYPVHLPALSGQVRVHITLQGDIGIGVSQQLAEGLYVAPCLQTGRCKGMTQCVRTYLPDSCLFQIRFNAFPVAAGFGRLGLVAGQKPCGITGISVQFFQHHK